MKKIALVIIFSIFFGLGIIFFFTYSPDNLIGFVPADADIYLHFDLNKFFYQGKKETEWLNKFWPEEFSNWLEKKEDKFSLLGCNLHKDTLSQVEEIGIVIKDKEIALLLLTKQKGRDYPFLTKKGESYFYPQALSRAIFAISSSKDFFLNQASLSRGQARPQYIYFTPEMRQNKIILKGKFLTNEAAFLKRSLFQSETFSLEKLFNLSEILKGDFIFSQPQKESIEETLFRIKESLAWKNLLEKESRLPDGTEFKELVVDPERFNFQEKKLGDTTLYSLEEKRMFLAKRDDCLFFSNSSSSLEKNISFSNPFPFFYWSINFGNLNDVFIYEKKGEIIAILRMD